jgi:hypothetical protein
MTRSRQTADWGSRAGLAKIVPSSVAVGSGTGSASTTGLVTVSGCSSVSVNGCFSATYTNYRIVMNIVGSTATDLRFKLRAAGSDNSASYYWLNTGFRDTGGSYQVGTAGDSSASINQIATQLRQQIVLDICRPFEAQETSITGKSVGQDNTSGIFLNPYMFHASNTSFDGLSLIPSSGTITGSFSIYGYNN